MTPTRRLRRGAIAMLTATAATLDPAAVWIGLYITGPTPSPPVTVADFALPDATDMPAIVLGSWGAVHDLLDGSSARDAPAKVFALPNATHGFSAGGYYLSDALTAGNVLAWQAFGAPIPMPNEFSPLTILLRVLLPGSGPWSSSFFIDG